MFLRVPVKVDFLTSRFSLSKLRHKKLITQIQGTSKVLVMKSKETQQIEGKSRVTINYEAKPKTVIKYNVVVLFSRKK